jgi:hypothetical protein
VERIAHVLALGIALAVNAAALAVVDAAMADGAEKDRLALQQPERVVISAPRVASGPEQPALSAANCPPARL